MEPECIAVCSAFHTLVTIVLESLLTVLTLTKSPRREHNGRHQEYTVLQNKKRSSV